MTTVRTARIAGQTREAIPVATLANGRILVCLVESCDLYPRGSQTTVAALLPTQEARASAEVAQASRGFAGRLRHVVGLAAALEHR